MKLRLSPRAADDLDRIAAYLEPRNPQAAQLVQQEIAAALRLLGAADLADANIPNVVDLVDDAQVRAEITTSITGKPPQPGVSAPANLSIAEEMAQAIHQRLDAAIVRARAVEVSPRLMSVKNHRHKYLAHNLTMTRLEAAGTVAPMKNGDIDWLFEETEAIVDALHHGLNRAGFDWSGCHEMHGRHADYLWSGTRFVDLK